MHWKHAIYVHFTVIAMCHYFWIVLFVYIHIELNQLTATNAIAMYTIAIAM